jgi:ribosomal protein L11 methyltransferase
MNKIYYGVEVAFSKENYDTIYNLLYAEGIKTILEENGIIKFSIEDKNSSELIKSKLLSLPSITEKDIFISKLENQDWNMEWEKSIEPVYIKDKIIVYPSWKKNELKNPNGKILIEIDPKMSFGTGHNETTQMMLELMYDYIDNNDKYLLDYGCGTAVLAIAGIKLGVKLAVAIDIDEESILNAMECVRKNEVSNIVKLYKTNINEISEKDFDIIVCNIDRTVILGNLKTINSKLKPGGKLFITGILREEENEVKDSFKKQKFELIETRNKAEWLAFYTTKQPVIPAKAEI